VADLCGPTQERRTLLRTLKQFVREKASPILPIQKTPEDANIKLDWVITDIIREWSNDDRGADRVNAIRPSWPA
jgi:hypothetical protein